MQFRIDAGDSILGQHFATACRNATYSSSNIQNQLLLILGAQEKGKILKRVMGAGWYSIIADEVSDLSNKELLSLVLHYIDFDTALVCEDFVSFLECDTGITGLCLADKILTFLDGCRLDPAKLRGQTDDRAGNMAGSVNGTAAIISSQYPLALYFHCASHNLNLAVVKSIQVTAVRNMLGTVNKVLFFLLLIQNVKRHLREERQPESRTSKLKDLCHTRWIDVFSSLSTIPLWGVWKAFVGMGHVFGPQMLSLMPAVNS